MSFPRRGPGALKRSRWAAVAGCVLARGTLNQPRGEVLRVQEGPAWGRGCEWERPGLGKPLGPCQPLPLPVREGKCTGQCGPYSRLAASEQGREPGHRGCVRDPGGGTVTVPCRQSLRLPALVQGRLRVRYPGEADSERPFPLSVYVQIITWRICLSLAKLIFLLRSASWVIKTAQPMVTPTQQVFSKPSSGRTKKVKDAVLPGPFQLRRSGGLGFGFLKQK